MLLWAMLAMVLVAAAPAIAQIGTQDEDDEEDASTPVAQEFAQEDVESGDVEPVVDITNTGDNVNMCLGLLQAANTGNVQNEQGVSQYLSYADDIEFEGSSIEISPEAVQECEQVIEQATAAGTKTAAKAGEAEAKGGGAAGGGGGGGAAGGGGGAAAAKAGVKTLPATGGIADIAPLLGIGAGALLVAGGLLARKMIR